MSAALIAAGRRVGAKQLTWGTAGNISARVPGGFVISASGARLDELTPDLLLTCPLEGDLPAGGSVEAGMHRAVYRARPDVNAVLHCSAFYTTLVACSAIELEPAASTDTLYYLRRLARLPFLRPAPRSWPPRSPRRPRTTTRWCSPATARWRSPRTSTPP